VVAARNARALETLAEEIRAGGGAVLVVATDVTDVGAVERLADRAVQHFGRIDTWVNNAAVSMYGTFEQTPVEEMRRQVDVNYWGAVHGFKAAIPRMKATGGGTVMAVASALADFAIPLQSTYCAAKHALRGLTEALRIELLHERVPIDVVLIKPPSVDTPFFRHALTHTGYLPKPIAPVYDPAVIAKRIVLAAQDPRREVMVGGAAQLFAFIHRNAPRLFEWQQARSGFEGQLTDVPKPPEGPTNFFHALDEPGETRPNGNGWKASWVMWLEEHPKTTAAAGAALLGAAAAWRRRR
jgi:MYXO-CTERM domain-containing protein